MLKDTIFLLYIYFFFIIIQEKEEKQKGKQNEFSNNFLRFSCHKYKTNETLAISLIFHCFFFFFHSLEHLLGEEKQQ